MMHDLKLERFGAEADGPIKTFVLRGIKDSPPYFHDGRLLTLEDAVEFFAIVGGTSLSDVEKKEPGGIFACLVDETLDQRHPLL